MYFNYCIGFQFVSSAFSQSCICNFRFDPATGLIETSQVCIAMDYEKNPIPWALRVLASLHLAKVEKGKISGKKSILFNNLTLSNFILLHTGPLEETRLALRMLILQVICCALTLYLRDPVRSLFFDPMFV